MNGLWRGSLERIEVEGGHPETVVLVTDYLRPAEAVAAVYRKRWPIELSFKALKRLLLTKTAGEQTPFRSLDALRGTASVSFPPYKMVDGVFRFKKDRPLPLAGKGPVGQSELRCPRAAKHQG